MAHQPRSARLLCRSLLPSSSHVASNVSVFRAARLRFISHTSSSLGVRFPVLAPQLAGTFHTHDFTPMVGVKQMGVFRHRVSTEREIKIRAFEMDRRRFDSLAWFSALHFAAHRLLPFFLSAVPTSPSPTLVACILWRARQCSSTILSASLIVASMRITPL